MDYSFWNNESSKLNKIKININAKWADIAQKADNKMFNSIWNIVDNGDGIVQQNEMELLNKLLEMADNSVDKTKGNGIIENEELSFLNNKIYDSSLVEELDQKIYGTVSGDAPGLKNFSYIEKGASLNAASPAQLRRAEMQNTNQEPVVANVDYSSLKANEEYYIEGYQFNKNNDGTYTFTPRAIEKMDAFSEKSYSWSEGLERNISCINLTSYRNSGGLGSELPRIIDELRQIGQEVGFEVNEVAAGNKYWLEDYGIRRADGKMLILSSEAANNVIAGRTDKDDLKNIAQSRANISGSTQGSAAGSKDMFSKLVRNSDAVESKSYLEGGNVLNTCLADGTPAAVIGSESIGYTLMAMGLEDTPENVEAAKNQIAADLGLKPENVTYIPQFDFHIDMFYRPLHNGEMAVPDYDEGIKVLKETDIKGMDPEYKQGLIEQLEELSSKTASIRQDAEKALSDKGYKIIKIPCFSDVSNSTINFMNGIAGTTKSGETFLITNSSDYPELNEAVQNYFKEAGVDKTYFLSTKMFLEYFGGIDCITQEL